MCAVGPENICSLLSRTGDNPAEVQLEQDAKTQTVGRIAELLSPCASEDFTKDVDMIICVDDVKK